MDISRSFKLKATAKLRPNAPRDEKNKEKLLCDV